MTANRLYSAFGSTVASAGDPLLAFGWVGDGESQTDADTGLVLMGHRLYDSRIGRFISQDPAGDGDNWYAYAGNDPVNHTDPSGNLPQTLNGGSASINSEGYNASLLASFGAALASDLVSNEDSYTQPPPGVHVDDDHSAFDHYLGKAGTPMYVYTSDLPYPAFADLGLDPSVQKDILLNYNPIGQQYAVDIDNISLNFKDYVVGRAVGHFEGTLTMNGGYMYSLDGKMFVHPDTYKWNNDPNRGLVPNAETNAMRILGDIRGGGTSFTINIYGYVPVHQHK